MPTHAELLQQAMRHHQAGELQRAEQLYRQLLREDPRHFDAMQLLGLLALQARRHDLGVVYISEALKLKPDFAPAHNNLGIGLLELGRVREAAASYERALRLDPSYAEAHNNLGNALRELGQLDEAIASYRRALQLRPEYPEACNNLGDALRLQGAAQEGIPYLRKALRLWPEYSIAHNNLGVALLEQGRPYEAADLLRKAIRLRPGYAEAHANLGHVFRSQGRLEEARACCAEAVRVQPEQPLGHNNLGAILLELGRRDEAEVSLREALRLRPNYAEAHANLGTLFLQRERLDDALACYDQAVRIDPAHAVAHSGRGAVLAQRGELSAALACYEKALQLKPNYAEAHRNRALVWLLQGDFARGWPESEWRWQCRGFAARASAQPCWDGSALAGRTILLQAEQGLGDTIQFARYARLVKERGGKVLLLCHEPLRRLLTGLAGVGQLLVPGERLPPLDVQAGLLSLPTLLGTTPASVPAQVPYLQADPGLVEQWRGKLARGPGLTVGIAWQGNPDYPWDRQRSVPLKEFAPLAGVKGVRLISLQKGPGVEQLAGSGLAVTDLGPQLDEKAGPFMDTAAVLRCVDLVISSDTAVAHLAGALGVPVWVALPQVPDWRWLLEREDSPWYPTMRLFRQQRAGDWGEVFGRIARALNERRA
jgi:tetratricopeptide (TPR) repeat protein